MTYDFRWNDWNIDHIAEHNVTVDEAEYLMEHPAPGYPEYIGNGRYRVRGQSPQGRYLQAVFIFSPAAVVYVIHARDLTERKKHKLRRRQR